MMTRRLLAVLAIGALSLIPARAQAQVGFSIAGGLSLPQGDLGSSYKSGYNVAAGLNLSMPLMPVGFRLEGAYNAFDAKGSTSGNSATANIASGTVNATFGLGLPYLIGGVGYYSAGGSATFSGTTTTATRESAMGVNGGVGMRFPLGALSTFAEVRYHKMLGDKAKGMDQAYIPITFGISF